MKSLAVPLISLTAALIMGFLIGVHCERWRAVVIYEHFVPANAYQSNHPSQPEAMPMIDATTNKPQVLYTNRMAKTHWLYSDKVELPTWTVLEHDGEYAYAAGGDNVIGGFKSYDDAKRQMDEHWKLHREYELQRERKLTAGYWKPVTNK